MQTFLPYPSFHRSARVLDPSRLGNQFYREGLTLLRGGWPNHLASRMWLDYDCQYALGEYLLACHDELERRGFSYPHHVREIKRRINPRKNRAMPPWIGNRAFHRSHKAALIYKRPDLYQHIWPNLEPAVPDERGSLPYVWPTRDLQL